MQNPCARTLYTEVELMVVPKLQAPTRGRGTCIIIRFIIAPRTNRIASSAKSLCDSTDLAAALSMHIVCDSSSLRLGVNYHGRMRRFVRSTPFSPGVFYYT